MIFKRLLIVFTIFSLFSACTKIQSTDIGSGLIPPVDGVTTFDTSLSLTTNTSFEENITRVYKTDDHVIGYIGNDPLFGRTDASVFFELKPAFYPFFLLGKNEERTVDSAVLILSYRGLYGDSTVPQTWRVFEVNTRDTLKYDSAYGTSVVIGHGSQLGFKSNFDLRDLNDSVNYGFENAKNQIRIKLDANFAKRLIKDYDTSATGAYKSHENFRKNFAGFAVVPDKTTGNALVRINLLDTNTKVALFYKYKTTSTPTKDTSVVSYLRFVTNAGTQTSGNANPINRNYTGSEVGTSIATQSDNFAYVQTSPGTYVRIRIPGLETFPNSLIHRAELVAEQVPPTLLDNTLSPPRYLLLSAYDSVNKIKRNIRGDYLIDPSSGTNNLGSFGGFLRKQTVNGTPAGYYNFNLTRYVQGIVTRKDTSYTLRLSAPSNDSLRYTEAYPATFSNIYYISPNSANNVAEGRVKLGGGAGPRDRPHRMKLRIIYSRL